MGTSATYRFTPREENSRRYAPRDPYEGRRGDTEFREGKRNPRPDAVAHRLSPPPFLRACPRKGLWARFSPLCRMSHLVRPEAEPTRPQIETHPCKWQT